MTLNKSLILEILTSTLLLTNCGEENLLNYIEPEQIRENAVKWMEKKEYSRKSYNWNGGK